MYTRLILAFSLFFAFGIQLDAAVTLPRLISDHMLLQRDMPARIWGKANPGEAVTVKFRGQSLSTKANTGGQWEVFLSPMKAGGPDTLRVEADNTITVQDVLVGDVWIASGQSNMQFSLSRARNAEQEIASANYARIRLFKVPLVTAREPRTDVEGEWSHCTPESAKDFTAVGYFFGRYLHKELHVPVAVIQTAWGGTPAEAWTSVEALKAEPSLHLFLNHWDRVMEEYPSEVLRYEAALKKWEPKAAAAKAAGKKPPRKPRRPQGWKNPHAPAVLYNAMIAPLTPYAIRGAIWYQGESNAERHQGYEYRRLFQTMILDWRARWGEGQFPFLFVQLANWISHNPNSQWPELREAQTMALQLRHTGMAVTTDIGNPNDIHPTNKQDVGKRLALWALADTYGRKLVYSGPLYRQVTKEDGKLRLWFDHVGGGLTAEGGTLKGFVIAGADRVFHPARARIDGKTVVVSSPDVADPAAARYGWADNPENTLRNAEGLPASPFRTDQWRNGIMPK